jgi:hypothetical protein
MGQDAQVLAYVNDKALDSPTLLNAWATKQPDQIQFQDAGGGDRFYSSQLPQGTGLRVKGRTKAFLGTLVKGAGTALRVKRLGRR